MVSGNESVAILIVALVITFFITKMFFNFMFFLFKNLPMPTDNNGDYWDDAGDGSGVNYVQMKDGSVRID